MTRRWRAKRARHAQPASDNLACKPLSYRDVLPTELWHITFSFCIPTTLFAVRNTCRLFRAVVDREDGKLLAHAPLLLPHSPPDPRWLLRVVKHPGKSKALCEFFGISDPRQPGRYGSATYTNLLFRSGRCNICGSWTPGPPEWIHSRLYFCSKRCKLKFFRFEVVFLLPQFNYLPARSATPEVDRHIVSWLPRLSMSSDLEWRDQKTQAILVNDLMKAREEYQNEVLAARNDHERILREKALFKRYSARNDWAQAMFMFQYYIDEWMRKMDKTKRSVGASNIRRLRRYAGRKNIATSRVIRHSAVLRPLKSRSRDLRRISLSSLAKANLYGATCKKRVCTQCGMVVSNARYDLHVAKSHPRQLPQNRLNFKTGKGEYRCEYCEDLPLKWYTAYSLQRHKVQRHGVHRQTVEEWHGISA
ncbi:hypothetical protein EV715DRAFT_209793 [Schizophyllum commune]